MGWIGQKGGPKVEEEKNVATAERNCSEQTDYLEQARKLADSYRLLIHRRDLLRQQYEDSKSWFYTKEEIVCALVHASGYMGIPRLFNALNTCKDLLKND